MGVNVYLSAKIREAEGFEDKPESGGNPVQHWTTPYFQRIRLEFDKGRYALHLHGLANEIPECLDEFVRSISVVETFPTSPRRTTGVYKHKKATAELDISRYHRNEFRLHITSKTLEDARELYRRIRAGKITPKESWEEEEEEEEGSEVSGKTVFDTAQISKIRVVELATIFMEQRLPDYTVVKMEVGDYVEEVGFHVSVTYDETALSQLDYKSHQKHHLLVRSGEHSFVTWGSNSYEILPTDDKLGYELSEPKPANVS